jgi:hypothetical protein
MTPSRAVADAPRAGGDFRRFESIATANGRHDILQTSGKREAMIENYFTVEKGRNLDCGSNFERFISGTADVAQREVAAHWLVNYGRQALRQPARSWVRMLGPPFGVCHGRDGRLFAELLCLGFGFLRPGRWSGARPTTCRVVLR